MRRFSLGLVCKRVLVVWASLTLWGCASHPARQNQDEWSLLKTALVSGEHIARGNSCSKVDSADFLGGGTAEFGSLFLTNLRLIYEESEWAQTLAAVGKAVPTKGDFGISQALKGVYGVFNANYVIDLGNDGKLHLVERTGRIIIPLSDIRSMDLSGSRFSSRTPGDEGKARWLTITTRGGNTFIFEIYNLPPDKTGMMPAYISGVWKHDIARVRTQSFQ